MSRNFNIQPVTADQAKRVRESQQIGLYEAQKLCRRDNIEVAIHGAKDLEDIKVLLLALLHGGFR